jgi:hypothetical protein
MNVPFGLPDSKDVLVLDPRTGELRAEPCQFYYYAIGVDAPLRLQCAVHGRYEAVAFVTTRNSTVSTLAITAFGRLLLAAAAGDCARRRRLWRGVQREYRSAVQRAGKAEQPIATYTAMLDAVARRVPLREALAALAAYPNQTATALGDAEWNSTHPVTLDPATGAIGIGNDSGAAAQIDTWLVGLGLRSDPLIAPCAAHGWDVIDLLPATSAPHLRHSALLVLQDILIAQASGSCDEFALRSRDARALMKTATKIRGARDAGRAMPVHHAGATARAVLRATGDLGEVAARTVSGR